MSGTRYEVTRIPDGAPEPDHAFYVITAEDVGRTRIRLSIGETIEFSSSWNSLPGLAVQAEHVGRRVIGLANKGFDGPLWYWAFEP